MATSAFFTPGDGGTFSAQLNGKTPEAISSVTTTKNVSKTTAKAAKKVTRAGKKAKLEVAVTALNESPDGAVKVMKGKVLGKGTLNRLGKATVKLKKVLPGASPR